MDVRVAQTIATTTPHGPMLAPNAIAGTLALLDSNYPQLRIREDAVRF